MNRDYRDRQLETQGLNNEALGAALRSLRRLTPGEGLKSSLRVLASQEQRRASGQAIAFRDRLRLFSRNLMRPLALPAAGGIISAIVLFLTISFAPALTVQASTGFDVEIAPSPRGRATVLNSDPSVVKAAPIFAYGPNDIIVDVVVNGEGGMIDYTIVSPIKDAVLERRIGQVLLLTKFNPATTLGAPHQGRVRLSLSASHSSIDVKG